MIPIGIKIDINVDVCGHNIKVYFCSYHIVLYACIPGLLTYNKCTISNKNLLILNRTPKCLCNIIVIKNSILTTGKLLILYMGNKKKSLLINF